MLAKRTRTLDTLIDVERDPPRHCAFVNDYADSRPWEMEFGLPRRTSGNSITRRSTALVAKAFGLYVFRAYPAVHIHEVDIEPARRARFGRQRHPERHQRLDGTDPPASSRNLKNIRRGNKTIGQCGMDSSSVRGATWTTVPLRLNSPAGSSLRMSKAAGASPAAWRHARDP